MVRLAIALSVCVLTACVDEGEPPDAALDQIVYTRTTIRPSPDGFHLLRRQRITAEQQALDLAQARLDLMNRHAGRSPAPASAHDCTTRLFDQPNHTGNELCILDGTPLDGHRSLDDAALRSLCRSELRLPSGRALCTQTWDRAVRSTWPEPPLAAVSAARRRDPPSAGGAEGAVRRVPWGAAV